ncbi:sodium/potassium/calcium exchanger 3-like [Watersipora subatra]|uniref:sodium/potassium/calcium exchanger 3-like n=1 Tax=Watersipora subatra TaxID=2589382 RepID=UPI00355C42C0
MTIRDSYYPLVRNAETATTQGNTHVNLRRTLSIQENTTENEPSAGLPWEQCAFEKSSKYSYLWVIHHLWWIFFFFIGLAVVCDDFFVPALEIISEKLRLSEDVAGATFMAAGSSAPELFTSLMGVAQQTDVGVGAIVGSAVFNILIIIALTGALAGQVLQLDWRPLARDITFYAVSIAAFLGASYDGKITWYEAVCLLLLYALYILTMVFNPRLMALLNKPACCRPSETEPDSELGEESAIKACDQGSNTEAVNGSPTSILHHRRVSFQKSSFSGGHARRLSIHNQLHSGKSSSLGNIWLENQSGASQAHGSNRKDSGFSDDVEKASNENTARMNATTIGNTLDIPKKNSYAEKEVIAEETEAALKSVLLSGNSCVSIFIARKPVLLSGNSCVSTFIALKPVLLSSNSCVSMSIALKPVFLSENIKQNGSADAKLSIDSATNKDLTTRADEDSDDGEDDELTVCSASCCPRIKSTPPASPVDPTCSNKVIYCLKWTLYVIAFPYYFLCTFTIPDCSKESNRKWYMATFCLSILWILALSFAMVTMVTRTGCIVEIDEFVMGLVVVAVGTSVPDCLSSILVARDGFGDMAVSNAIGSNVFDINLGLGFPFLLRILIDAGKPMLLLGSSEQELVEEGRMPVIPHVKFAIILLGLLFIIFLLFVFSKFKLNKLISVSFVVLYVLFIVYALVQQLLCYSYLC